MKVFFTASYSAKEQYQPVYDKVVAHLKKRGDQIISLEVQSYEDVLGVRTVSKLPKDDIHYTYIKKGMARCDAVIIEASTDKFRLGHEATIALFYNKPVLCISDKKDYSSTIKHPGFYSEEYVDASEVPGIVDRFLKMCEKKILPVRFNGFFSSSQMNFLKWYGNKTGKTVSELLRGMVDDKIKTEGWSGLN